VYVQEVERTVSVPSSNLEPIIPEKNDKVLNLFITMLVLTAFIIVLSIKFSLHLLVLRCSACY